MNISLIYSQSWENVLEKLVLKKIVKLYMWKISLFRNILNLAHAI
jgi:hypothetical protein